jgi:hypothetical protein
MADTWMTPNRKQSLLDYISEGANIDDLMAAGYTEKEVQEVSRPRQSDFTARETDTVQPYTHTYRENFAGNVEGGLKALGLPEGVAKQTARNVAGTSPNQGEEFGLADFSPLGILFGGQEGYRQAERGYNTGSKTDMALGALNTGLSVAEAIPGVGVAAKGVGKASDKLLEMYDPSVTYMFGGRKATSPGLERGYSPLPETTGADNLYRFEFSDREAVVLPKNISVANYKSPTFDINKDTSKLADVLIHDELFYQYPDLADQKIFVDEVLKNSNTRGYYLADKNLMAISPDLLQDPKQLKKTLLHEIQHVIQSKEGFSLGTAPENIDVAYEGPKQINSDKNKNAWKTYEAEIKAYENPANLKDPLQRAENFLKDYAEGFGYRLTEPNFVQSLVDKVRKKQTDPILAKNLINLYSEVKSALNVVETADPKYFSYYAGKLDHIYKNLANLAKDPSDPNDWAGQLFKGATGLAPDDIMNQYGQLKFNPVDVFLPPPQLPALPAPGTSQVENWVFHTIYERKRGETEARNTAERMDMTVEERFKTDPELTEDVARDDQWGDPGFAKGGMVENIDPISGNEVPPGAKPEEVRDDVPIMASEGEYVIPANVVRYIGLDRIEKMIKQAKKGLMELDAEGRIGGEKATMDEDLPFSPEELMAVDEAMQQAPAPAMMAEGGLVTNFDMDIDPATGLPKWLLAMQQGQTEAPKAEAPKTGSRVLSGGSTTAPTQERGSDRSQAEKDALKPTGLAKPVSQWSVDDYNKYADFRTSPEASVFKAATAMVPLGGIISAVGQRATERSVNQNLTEMIKSGKDLNGKPLSTDQLNTLRETYSRVTGEPISRLGGLSGAAVGLARNAGLIDRKGPTAEQTQRYNERVQGDSLLNRVVDFIAGNRPATRTGTAASPSTTKTTDLTKKGETDRYGNTLVSTSEKGSDRTTTVRTPGGKTVTTSTAPVTKPSTITVTKSAPAKSTTTSKTTSTSSASKPSQASRAGFAKGGLIKKRNK